MEFARRRLFYHKQDFQLAWEGLPNTSAFFSHLRHPDRPTRAALSDAGHYLGGALLAEGFQMFKNGGLPLIERRTTSLIEEIVLRASPHVCDEPFLPIRISLHLSHSGLQDVRLRYWRPASRAPSCVACLDIGQLELPPCWVIWNVGLDYQVLVEIVEWVRRLALPWFSLFENREALKQALYQREVSGVGLDMSLELMLAEFGPNEAHQFLEECVLPDMRIGPMVRETTRRISRALVDGAMGHDAVLNIATIASAYSLL